MRAFVFMPNQYTQAGNAYDQSFQQIYLPSEAVEVFNLTVDDDKLNKMLIKDLQSNVDYWDKSPFKLRDVDVENVKYFLGDQLGNDVLGRVNTDKDKYIDNRLFSSMRAILSYATGQLATPEVTPSRSDQEYLNMARNIQQALYQHSADEHVDQKVRAAVLNLLLRKRGYLKLRYDPDAGLYGDVVTEVCNPEDIIIDRYAGFMDNPRIIYHRLRCTVDELCYKFPKKADAIRQAFSIKRGTYGQMSQMVTYFEAWFTYLDNKGKKKEGLAWFIEESSIILDKQPNPNWIYTGDDQKDKVTNVTFTPPKPFVGFNYINLGKSFIDETSLFEQAKPQQDILNERGRQFNKNIALMNGRWVMSKKAVSDQDATKFINRGAKSVLLVNGEDVGKAAQVMTPNAMPPQVYESIQDTRNEIDGIAGTPSIFKGANPSSQDTLGRDQLLKQQAGMLQDDLVKAVQVGMEDYYQKKLQMWRVFYTDDYWFQVKGGDGKYDFIMLNGDSLDSNVKIGVQVDSTLPLDKANIRFTAMELMKAGKIDQLTLMEDLGLPNPEIRTERWLRSNLDPIGYMDSIETQMENSDADVDIKMLMDGKIPEERDDYNAEYINYFNHFISKNKFQQLTPQQQQAITQFLAIIQLKANRSANLQESMLNDAGILDQPVNPPMPKRDVRITVPGAPLSPQATAQATGTPPPPAGSQPSQQAQPPTAPGQP